MGHVAAVGKFAKDSNVVKKTTDDASITMHCKWCHDWAGTIATKGRHLRYKGNGAIATRSKKCWPQCTCDMVTTPA
jgi:hypothetical protein